MELQVLIPADTLPEEDQVEAHHLYLVEMEVVALGLGLGVLTLDSPQGPRVADALKLGVHINACQTTMTRRKLSKEDMLPNIGIVPGGLVQIIKRQREGWAYIGT